MPKDPDPTIIAEQADAARKLGQALEQRFGQPPARTTATATVTLTVTVACGMVYGGNSTIDDIHMMAIDDAKERLATLLNGGRGVNLSGIHSIAIALNSERTR